MKLTLPFTLLTILTTASAAVGNTGTLVERQGAPACASLNQNCGGSFVQCCNGFRCVARGGGRPDICVR
ncbi:hypothetical protein HYFRA_00013505 [Hymenoscyphus fraxineus]|uniref:Uncharacterized protein n=1 Tax=Hymenoscyphus fraxineus TaxID=746836 RepID=A0A9N9LBX4_9HELO|nr:hypothetical protein HYFRA_00013505 [Hymenoscyphus fraxineus]